MALSKLGQDTVQKAMQQARTILETLNPLLGEFDVAYNTVAIGLKATITQPDLDGVAAFSGLTKAQLDDGMFALTSTLKNSIATAYTQLAQLAVRA